MKKQIIFISGWESKENYKDFIDYLEKIEFNPYEEKMQKWDDFLEDDLKDQFEVIKIPMPNKHFADYKSRKIMFEKVFSYMKENTILVWYSLGWTFLAKYFNEEKINFSFSKIFLLAPAFKDDEREVLWNFNFDQKLENLAKYAEKITILHSKDDFVVPYDHFLEFQKVLPKAKFITFEDKNHFIIEKFPEFIEILKRC